MLKVYIHNMKKKDSGVNAIEEEICYQLARDIRKDDDEIDKSKLWYQFVRSLLDISLETFPKSRRLRMLHAYLQHEKLENKYKALFELMLIQENKPNIQEEFAMCRYKDLIEREMIENDQKYSDSKEIDVNVIVHFQNSFVEFQSDIEKSVNLYLSFWRELLETSPDIQKLQSLGSRITNQVEATNTQFRKLSEMNPNHIKCLQIYGNFLKDIVNDYQEGQKILEKADYIDKSSMVNKQLVHSDVVKYGENSNTCIITCSGNLNEIGLVMNCNNEITRILNYSKNDLIGRNINSIMPPVISQYHNAFMMRYFETSKSEILCTEREVFPINKKGYLVPCTLMIKILPNLDEGIRIVGFLRELDGAGAYFKNIDSDEKVHYVMYGGDNDMLQGITASCYYSYGIPASLIYGNTLNNEFCLDAIFPGYNVQNLEELRNPSGAVLELDTTNLPQEYLLGNEQGSEQDESFNESDQEGYISYNTRLYMRLELTT